MNSVIKVTILLGCSAAAALTYAGGQAGVNTQGDGGVQAAIRFERAKDAADARQASIEAANPHSAVAAGAKSAAETGAVTVRDSGVEAAIRFEHNKDAADARQARIDQQQQTTMGNADRRMTGHN